TCYEGWENMPEGGYLIDIDIGKTAKIWGIVQLPSPLLEMKTKDGEMCHIAFKGRAQKAGLRLSAEDKKFLLKNKEFLKNEVKKNSPIKLISAIQKIKKRQA
ncbi:MAG: hypothetical protein AB7E52_03195, partial [Bdellovibrionales bacterium]